MKISVSVEEGVIPQLIDEVFDRYKYNMKFSDPDEVKEEILEKILAGKYDNLIWREKYLKFSLTTYFHTLIRSYCAGYLKKQYDERNS